VRSGLLELADTFCVERQALDRLFEEVRSGTAACSSNKGTKAVVSFRSAWTAWLPVQVPGPEVVGAVEGAEGAEGEDSEQGSMLRSAGDKCEASTPGF
jgi:hypothetical protein